MTRFPHPIMNRLPLVALLAACFMAGGAAPSRAQEDLAVEANELMQKISTADNPCIYAPQMRDLLMKAAAQDPDNYQALKAAADALNIDPASCEDKKPTEEPNPNEGKSTKGKESKKKEADKINVSFTNVETRPLTDAEESDLRAGLRWQPETASISEGGTAQSSLVNKDGKSLATVKVRWERAAVPKLSKSQDPAPITGLFTVTMNNDSTCVFTSSAEFDESGSSWTRVDNIKWFSWVNLHQPLPGQSSVAQGKTDFRQSYKTLDFKPLDPGTSLRACRTPKEPPAN
jgi:hypothetical protein